jgi:hypothetical protein
MICFPMHQSRVERGFSCGLSSTSPCRGGRLPSVEVTGDSNDVHVLRSEIEQLKARVKEQQSLAEAACYEVETRHRDDKHAMMNASGAVVTGKVQLPSSVLHLEQPTPEASPIPLLEAMKNLVTAEEEEDGWDLLRDDVNRRGTHTTVGIRLAQNSSETTLRPLQIQLVIPGSSAHICGLLERGDEIIAVDGRKVGEKDIVAAVRGTDIVGSKVVLTVKKDRSGKMFDVALVRGAWGAVERKERLFILLDELKSKIKHGESQSDVLAKLDTVVHTAMEHEKFLSVSEMKIHDRLHSLQGNMRRLLQDSTVLTQHLLDRYSQMVSMVQNQVPELTIALHERVEAYIKDLQRRLQQADAQAAEYKGKAEAAAEWIESVRDMERLAAFSRMRIKNFERHFLGESSALKSAGGKGAEAV